METNGQPMQGRHEQENAGEPGGSLSQQVKAQIKVPPELREPYERIVLAGMKVMFSEETNEMAMQSLQGEGPIEQRLAKGICDLMVLLWQESNQSMPPQLIIPAAVELLAEAADFLVEAGVEQIEPQQIGEAMRLMIGMILQRFNVTPETMQKGAAQGQGAEGQRPVPAGAASGPPPASGGVIGAAMGGR
jgi:hypothetical protein